MQRLKTVLWDLDGTIADTEMKGHRKAFNKAFNDFDLSWNWDENLYNDLLKVGGGKERIQFYANDVGIKISFDLIKDIHSRKQSYYLDIINSGEIDLRIGVLRLFNELQQYRVNQWIVTTSSREAAIKLVNSCFGTTLFPFHGIVSAEDVIRHKPSPEAYLTALRFSESTSKDTIVIEDSAIGLQSARSANLKCIVTLSPWLQHSNFPTNGAELVVNHLGDPRNKSVILDGQGIQDMVNYNYLESILSM